MKQKQGCHSSCGLLGVVPLAVYFYMSLLLRGVSTSVYSSRERSIWRRLLLLASVVYLCWIHALTAGKYCNSNVRALVVNNRICAIFAGVIHLNDNLGCLVRQLDIS